ncbi:hypothetical protein [Motilibacter peucedani]|nr:hypothetical protein [Motilibacter peucedani]
MAEGGAPTPWPAVVVPDDARDLEPDRRAWLREQRRARWRAALTSTRSGRSRPLALLVTLAVAVTATLGGLAAAVLPHPLPARVPLAVVSVADGRTGGLLPATALATRAGPVPSRAVRPAAVLVTGASCGCAPTVDALARAAAGVGVEVWVVAPEGARDSAVQLTRGLHPGVVVTATDTGGALRSGLDEAGAAPADGGPVLLLVRSDGVVEEELSGPALAGAVSSTGIDVTLASLTRPRPVTTASR